MNRRLTLTEPIFRVSESYWNVKIYFLNTCGGGSLEKEEKKNRKLPFHCSSAFRIIRALNKPVYGLIRNDLMRRRKKKTIYFLWSYQKSKSICGHYLGKKREKRKPNVVKGIVFTWTFSICQKFHGRFRNH